MTVAILLAAGRSQRMGRQKLLLPIHGVPLLAHAARAFPFPLVERLFIVIPPHADALRQRLHAPHVQWVENPELESDMLASVRCGLRALPAGAQTLIVTPADMPGLSAELTAAMLTAYSRCGRSLLAPVFQGKRGHPLIFSARHVAEVLRGFDGVGLRGLLQAHAEELFEWPAPTAAVLQDLDTPEDFHRWTEGIS